MAWTPDGKGVYPDFPSMMSIAKNVNWGTTDLFPAYGMPSFLALVGPIQPGPALPKKSKSRVAKGGA